MSLQLKKMKVLKVGTILFFFVSTFCEVEQSYDGWNLKEIRKCHPKYAPLT